MTLFRPALALLLLVPVAAAQPDDALVLLRGGDALPNGWRVEGIDVPSIADDGTWAALVRTDQPPGMPFRAAVGITALRNGIAFYQDGIAAPLDGSVWQHDTNPAVAKAPGGAHAIASRLRLSNGNLAGIVIGGGQILARQGFPIMGGSGSIAGAFSTVPVAQAADGLTVYKLPTNLGSVLMAGDEVLLRAGVSTASGVTIVSTRTSRRETLDVTTDGDRIVAEERLGGGDDALVLVLVERRLGAVGRFAAQMQSTGTLGVIVTFR